jgi:hypothetical protein
MQRQTARIALLVLGLSLVAFALPSAVAACSCASPDEQLRMAGMDPRTVVLTGEAGQPTAGGVPVAVARWFTGAGAAPVIVLSVDRSDESSCGTTEPPAGQHYLFVLWRQDDGRLLYHLCSLAADLSTDDGRARLAQTEALFGPGTTPDPGATAPPLTALDPAALAAVLLPLVIVLVIGGGFLFGVVAVLRRTRPDEG